MAQFTVNATRFDPYKSFMFRVKWDGEYVAGLSKMSALKRTTEPVVAPRGRRPVARAQEPGQVEVRRRDARARRHATTRRSRRGPTSCTRSSSPISLKNFRKDVIVDVFNEAGQKVLSYQLFRCWVSEFQALPALDAGNRGGRDRDDQARARGLGARRVGRPSRRRPSRSMHGRARRSSSGRRARRLRRRRARAGARAAPGGRRRGAGAAAPSPPATARLLALHRALTGRDVEVTATCAACGTVSVAVLSPEAVPAARRRGAAWLGRGGGLREPTYARPARPARRPRAAARPSCCAAAPSAPPRARRSRRTSNAIDDSLTGPIAARLRRVRRRRSRSPPTSSGSCSSGSSAHARRGRARDPPARERLRLEPRRRSRRCPTSGAAASPGSSRTGDDATPARSSAVRRLRRAAARPAGAGPRERLGVAEADVVEPPSARRAGAAAAATAAPAAAAPSRRPARRARSRRAAPTLAPTRGRVPPPVPVPTVRRARHRRRRGPCGAAGRARHSTLPRRRSRRAPTSGRPRSRLVAGRRAEVARAGRWRRAEPARLAGARRRGAVEPAGPGSPPRPSPAPRAATLRPAPSRSRPRRRRRARGRPAAASRRRERWRGCDPAGGADAGRRRQPAPGRAAAAAPAGRRRCVIDRIEVDHAAGAARRRRIRSPRSPPARRGASRHAEAAA